MIQSQSKQHEWGQFEKTLEYKEDYILIAKSSFAELQIFYDNEKGWKGYCWFWRMISEENIIESKACFPTSGDAQCNAYKHFNVQ